MRADHKAALLLALTNCGSCAVRVGGRSMWPFIRQGDDVTLVPCTGEPCIGSVAATFVHGQLIVHRVVAKQRREGTLRIGMCGDSSPGPLAWVDPHEIIGIVTAVRRNGRSHAYWFRPPFSFVAVVAAGVLRMIIHGTSHP